MYKNMFTQEQIEQLLINKNVVRCTPKAITYHPDFKIRAVKQYYEEGVPPTEIFIQAEFNLAIIGAKTPKGCLSRWRRTFRTKGVARLSEDKRGKKGGRPKTKNLTDKEKIEYLEAKVAYLKAENDFLAKLRVARKE